VITVIVNSCADTVKHFFRC